MNQIFSRLPVKHKTIIILTLSGILNFYRRGTLTSDSNARRNIGSLQSTAVHFVPVLDLGPELNKNNNYAHFYHIKSLYEYNCYVSEYNVNNK